MDQTPDFYNIKPIAHTWISLPGYTAPDMKTAGLVLMSVFHAPWICALLNIIFLILAYENIFLLSSISLLLSAVAAIAYAFMKCPPENGNFRSRSKWISLGAFFILPIALIPFHYIFLGGSHFFMNQSPLANFAWYGVFYPLFLAQLFSFVLVVWITEIFRFYASFKRKEK